MSKDIFKWKLQGKYVAQDTIHGKGGREALLASLCDSNVIQEIEPHRYEVLENFEYYNERSDQWVKLLAGKEFFRLPKYSSKTALAAWSSA